MNEYPPPPPSFETLCAADGEHPKSGSRPLSMPIVAASVFEFESLEGLAAVTDGRDQGFIYARGGHPNQTVLEQLVASLEGAAAGLACASGMGAIAAALMPGLRSGDRIVADTALYGRTAALISGPLAALGVEPVFTDLSDTQAAARALSEPANVVIVESLSNPLLSIPDIEELATLAHAAGARLVVDNTVASPYHCRPIRHGADIVVHSVSKFLGGHSDAIGGVLAGSAAFIAQAREHMVTLGSPASPFDCWLIVRGMKTLAVRMARASENAEHIASFLCDCEGTIQNLFYPSLPSHPQSSRAQRLFEHGYGAMIAFELRGGRRAASQFVRGLQRIRFAPSFGDVSTTVAYPAGMAERPRAAGPQPPSFPAGLMRLSVGIEHPDDIIADLRLGLASAAAT